MTIETLTAFFGWTTAIHFALLLLAAVFLLGLRGPISALHAGMTGIDQADLPRVYFVVIAFYKILILVFGLVPYLVLRLGMVG